MAADDRDRVLVDVDGDADAQLLAGEAALARLPVALGETDVADVGLVNPGGVARHDPVLVVGYLKFNLLEHCRISLNSTAVIALGHRCRVSVASAYSLLLELGADDNRDRAALCSIISSSIDLNSMTVLSSSHLSITSSPNAPYMRTSSCSPHGRSRLFHQGFSRSGCWI